MTDPTMNNYKPPVPRDLYGGGAPIGPVQPSGFHGLASGSLAPPPVDPAIVAAWLASQQGSGAPPPAPAPPPPDATVYPDGALPADPNAPLPPGPSALPPLPGATPTTAAAQATGFPQSAWSLALAQRMANGGIGPAMDFYNFVKNRGVMPPVDPNAPVAPPPVQQPRPLVISPTNTSPAQIIPQQAPPQGPGGPMPQQPAMPPIQQPGMPNIAQPQVPTPGQMPGGVPGNPQMPGFYGVGKGPAQR